MNDADLDPERFAVESCGARGFAQAYVRQGAGGVPLLLIHGFPETKRIWWRVIEPLAVAGFDVIAPDRARRAGLSYLALGDWHGFLKISDRVWYSGTPEPDRFPDNEPGFALVVRLDEPGGLPKVERHATAHYTWLKRVVDVTEPANLDQVLAQLSATPNPEHVLVSIAVSGTPSLAVWGRCEAQLAGLEQKLFHLLVDSAAVMALPEVIELEEFGAGDLRQAAELLGAMARVSSDGQAAAASLALRKLYGMVRQIRAGGRA